MFQNAPGKTSNHLLPPQPVQPNYDEDYATRAWAIRRQLLDCVVWTTGVMVFMVSKNMSKDFKTRHKRGVIYAVCMANNLQRAWEFMVITKPHVRLADTANLVGELNFPRPSNQTHPKLPVKLSNILNWGLGKESWTHHIPWQQKTSYWLHNGMG